MLICSTCSKLKSPHILETSIKKAFSLVCMLKLLMDILCHQLTVSKECTKDLAKFLKALNLNILNICCFVINTFVSEKTHQDSTSSGALWDTVRGTLLSTAIHANSLGEISPYKMHIVDNRQSERNRVHTDCDYQTVGHPMTKHNDIQSIMINAAASYAQRQERWKGKNI